jgi:LPS-assembly protein
MRNAGVRGRHGEKSQPSGVASASYRRLLLAGAGLLALAPLSAHAASASAAAGLRGSQPVAIETVTAAVSDAPGADGLGPRDVYFEADTVIDDREAKTMTARGSVEARYQGRILRANEVVYNTETGAAVAKGDTVLINADGTTEYSQEVVLDDELRSGVAVAFAARMQNNVTIAAGVAIRRNENVNELHNAIFTPCDICTEEGPKEPTWSIQASNVLQDRENQVIYYRNAVIRVKGIPVFYSPVFWHPDPSADRRSGLLVPRFRYNERLGLSYEQPYLQVIGKSADLVVTPQFNTKVNPLLNLEYRQRFWSGQLNARVGYTYEQRFDGAGKFGNSASRSYYLADGLFQLTDKWRWGFGAEYVTDPTLFARYGVEDVFVRRGPFTTDTQRLISQAYAARQDDQSYLSISAIDFQSLRVLQVGRALVSYDTTEAFPTVAPLIEARYSPADPVLGGRLRLLGHAVILHRDDKSPLTPAGILQNQSIDSRRVSGQADWRATATLAGGLRVEPFLTGRADIYSIDNPLAAKRKTGFSRAIGTVGADFSWPFIKQSSASSIILEPIGQIALSPDHRPNRRVPNEDSVALEFDETNLFSPNRFSGFDLYEGGQRVNVGGRATFNWGNNRSASFLVGRSFRTDPDPAFYLGSGLEGGTSDWVTSASIAPIRGLSVFARSRLDSKTLRIRRQEAGADINLWRVSATARYLYSERDLTGAETQSMNLGATLNLTRNWGVSVASSQDLETGIWPYSQVSLFYQDECIRLDLMFTHDETFASTIVPSDSIRLRLTLATLGGQGR